MRRVTISVRVRVAKKKSVLVNVTLMLGAALKDYAAAMATTSRSTNGNDACNIPGLRIIIMRKRSFSWTCSACAGATGVSERQKEDAQSNKTRKLMNP